MYLVFDIGATKTRLALSSDGDSFSKTVVFNTDATAGGQARLVTEARKLVAEHKVTLVAGGATGTIDRQKGIVLESPNLPDWGRVDLGHSFKQAFKAPLILENDTAVVGLGEVASAVDRRGIIAYMTISTGVNGVRIIDGQIDRSTYGFELGRQIVGEAGEHMMNLEELIGGQALQRRYGRLPKAIDDPAVWHAETNHLAVALYNLMLHWSPREIILGGSMMRDIPLDWVSRAMHRLPRVFPEWPELRRAELGDLGGLYGALELIRQRSDRYPEG